MLITMLFCIGDLDNALNSDAPYLVLFDNTGESGVAILLNVVVFLLVFSGNITALATCSREVWAFARDKGFPFSRWISHVRFSLFTLASARPKLHWRHTDPGKRADELEVQHPLQRRLPDLGPHWRPLPHQPWLDSRLQHHCLALPPRPPVHLHDLHRLRPAPPPQGRGTSSRPLEPRPLRPPDQHVRLLLRRLRPRLLLLPRRRPGRPGDGQLGAGRVGRCHSHFGGRVLFTW